MKRESGSFPPRVEKREPIVGEERGAIINQFIATASFLDWDDSAVVMPDPKNASRLVDMTDKRGEIITGRRAIMLWLDGGDDTALRNFVESNPPDEETPDVRNHLRGLFVRLQAESPDWL